MKEVLLALLGLTRVSQLLCEVTFSTMMRFNTDKENANIANTGLEFLKVIKEDLRRNNDDYAVDSYERQRPLTKLVRSESLEHSSLELALDTRRTLNETEKQTTVTSNNTNGTLFRSNTQNPRNVDRVRVDKLKRFIAKGKKRLRELANSSSRTKQWAIQPIASHAEANHYVVQRQHPLDAAAVSAEPGLGRLLRQLQHRVDRDTPSPNQIDMAPARDGSVNAMRFKGRLCQRNVLNPEGPKYDSKGSTIWPEHRLEDAKGREFLQTKPPLMILPRCCNCCKKSVLGCQ